MKMNRITTLFLTLILFCTFTLLSSAADVRPVEPKKTDKCPVCGMFVAKYKHWIAEVVFKDGTYAVFDGPKDMFKYYLNLGKYAASRKPADIAGIYVTEYYAATLQDARKMYYVTGSDVLGPMGDELIPISTETGAREFIKDHKGSRIVKFPEVTNELLH